MSRNHFTPTPTPPTRQPSTTHADLTPTLFPPPARLPASSYCIHKNGDRIVFWSRNMKDCRQEYYAHFGDILRTNVLAEQCA